jgi:hypothetical protein
MKGTVDFSEVFPEGVGMHWHDSVFAGQPAD